MTEGFFWRGERLRPELPTLANDSCSHRTGPTASGYASECLPLHFNSLRVGNIHKDPAGKTKAPETTRDENLLNDT